jgi:hypothetical protein
MKIKLIISIFFALVVSISVIYEFYHIIFLNGAFNFVVIVLVLINLSVIVFIIFWNKYKIKRVLFWFLFIPTLFVVFTETITSLGLALKLINNISSKQTEKTYVEIQELENINSPELSHVQNLYSAIYNGDINYIQRYIENFDSYSREHENLTNDDLKILRNTILAMHGQIFKSRDLQKHFQNFEWYNASMENVENKLSQNESRLIRVILAMEQANPPTRDDLIGHWVTPVTASVENIGFLDLYLEADGSMSDFANGSWFWDGTIFRTIPADDYQCLHFSWVYGDIENFRIIVFEYAGELYKATSFFSDGTNQVSYHRFWYQANKMPSMRSSAYWGNFENTE